MEDNEKYKDGLIEGPASPQTDLSSPEEMNDMSQVSDQSKTGDSPDYVAVPPYGPGNQKNYTNDVNR